MNLFLWLRLSWDSSFYETQLETTFCLIFTVANGPLTILLLFLKFIITWTPIFMGFCLIFRLLSLMDLQFYNTVFCLKFRSKKTHVFTGFFLIFRCFSQTGPHSFTPVCCLIVNYLTSAWYSEFYNTVFSLRLLVRTNCEISGTLFQNYFWW